jgi:hypothetical protein
MNPVTVHPWKISRLLGAATVLLVMASTAGQLMTYWGGRPEVYGLVHLFFLGDEGNIPTYFSAVMLLLSALLLAVIAILKKRTGDRYRRYWAALSLAFVYMSIDEAAQFHELMSRPVEELLGHSPGGIFSYAWVIPGAAIMFLVALLFLRFVLHLPPKIRLMTFAAGAIFLGGSIGFELIEGRFASLYGGTNLAFSLITTTEETLEMAAVIMWIHTLLTYVAEQYQDVRFKFVEVKSNRRQEHIES